MLVNDTSKLWYPINKCARDDAWDYTDLKWRPNITLKEIRENTNNLVEHTPLAASGSARCTDL